MRDGARPKAAQEPCDMWPVSTAAAHALFLLPHLAQPPFGPRPLHWVELSVHADAQLVGLAAQAIAALAGVLAIAPLAITGFAAAALAITGFAAAALVITGFAAAALVITGFAAAALVIAWSRPRPAAAVIALQIAVVVPDIADAAPHIGERSALLAPVGAAAGRDQRIAVKRRTHATAQIRALRQTLRCGRLHPRDSGQQHPG